MKKSFRNFFSCIVFLILLGTSILKLSDIFVYNYSNRWYLEDRIDQLNFYKEGEIEALYVGASKVSVGINPIQIWKETGLTGINIATNTQPPLVTKYLTKKYADKLKPKYIFLEPAGILTDSALSQNATYRYETGLQFLENKHERNKLLNELKEDFPDDEYLEYQLPLYRDHSRWKSLTISDFQSNNKYDDFFFGYVNEMPMLDEDLSLDQKTNYSKYLDITDIETNSISERYYQELVNYLKEKNIQIIIVALPDLTDNRRPSAYYHFAEANDLLFFDFSLDQNFTNINFQNKV